MDNLDSILGKAIYTQLRERCRGWIKVEIGHNECFICIKYNGVDFAEIYDHLDYLILSGEFTLTKVVDDFIEKWQKYYHNIVDKKLFYTVKEAPYQGLFLLIFGGFCKDF